MIDFISNFPSGYTPRDQQKKALNKIKKIWDKGKKVAIAILPTGSGKSHIAKTICDSSPEVPEELKKLILDYSIYRKNKDNECCVSHEFLNSDFFGGYVLTVTKSLQDQYVNTFKDNIAIKGKTNYQCYIDDNFTTEFAPCSLSPKQKEECFSKNICPYYKTRNEGLSSKTCFLNYSVFFNLPDFLQKRKYLILDEAAELEQELVSNYSININYKQLKSFGVVFTYLKSQNSDECLAWLLDIKNQIDDIYIDLIKDANSFIKNKTFGSLDSKLSGKISKVSNLLSALDNVILFWKKCEYLLESQDAENVLFSPYNIKPFIRNILDKAENVLLMSATISDPEEYAKGLGIEKDEYEFFEIDSTFDPKKSPIICSKRYCLNFKNIDSILPKLLDSVIDVCDKHPTEKGIIHTHTNKILAELKKKVGKNSRFLFREQGITNEMILNEHKNTKEPTILVSPSLDTGVSLDDELGRFQIICKAPYLPLGSNRIKKMFNENSKKYGMFMIDNVIQMCGRCTRSENDYSVTYILDGSLVKAIERESSHLPDHFLKRFI